MKRVEIERKAIVKALDSSRATSMSAQNISVAAKQLGAARRTLQARMRDYGIPKGDPGRPRELLPYSSGFEATSLLPWLACGAVLGLGLYVYLSVRKDSPAAVTGVRMTGLDLLGATR